MRGIAYSFYLLGNDISFRYECIIRFIKVDYEMQIGL